MALIKQLLIKAGGVEVFGVVDDDTGKIAEIRHTHGNKKPYQLSVKVGGVGKVGYSLATRTQTEQKKELTKAEGFNFNDDDLAIRMTL